MSVPWYIESSSSTLTSAEVAGSEVRWVAGIARQLAKPAGRRGVAGVRAAKRVATAKRVTGEAGGRQGKQPWQGGRQGEVGDRQSRRAATARWMAWRAPTAKRMTGKAGGLLRRGGQLQRGGWPLATVRQRQGRWPLATARWASLRTIQRKKKSY